MIVKHESGIAMFTKTQSCWEKLCKAARILFPGALRSGIPAGDATKSHAFSQIAGALV